jgi:hypothetical protein
MTTHPLFPRIGPFTWLLLQASSVVASILLAFAIDAWWEQRTAAAEKNAVLTALRKELAEQREALDEELVYQRASRDNSKLLLAAIAAGRYEDTQKTLDHRLADLTWFSSTRVSSGLLDGLLRGGNVTAVEDETLRRTLTEWPGWISQYEGVSSQEHVTYTEVLLPFFSRHSSLPQISNVGYERGRPGDGWGADPEALVPVGPTVDHSTLLRNQEFAGVVIRKLSNTSDVLLTIGTFSEAMNELIGLIDQELANTT